MISISDKDHVDNISAISNEISSLQKESAVLCVKQRIAERR